jgi:hypothetical protein
LRLVVRGYDPKALKCYLHCGFKETGRDGTLISMEKVLPEELQEAIQQVQATLFSATDLGC